MAKNKFIDKLKEGVSVHEVEEFARKYTLEVFLVLAILIGAVSSVFDFFTGPGLTILFATAGIVLGVFFPTSAESWLRQIFQFSLKQEKTTQMILGSVKVIIGIFVPFILFGVVGLLAGTSYHHFIHQLQSVSEKKGPKSRRGNNEDNEHD